VSEIDCRNAPKSGRIAEVASRRIACYDQPFLLPPSLQDWLPESHLARFVADVMNELDLSTIYASMNEAMGEVCRHIIPC
jgi:hypothetical protein